jgi:hypothetical protein
MKDALAAFALGAAVATPMLAWSGGDPCFGSNPYSFDRLVLAPTATLVDGVPVATPPPSPARPLPEDPHAITLDSDDAHEHVGTDDRHAIAYVIDPRDGSRILQQYLVRR